MDDKTFKFGLGADVSLPQSGERGTVIGRADYLHAGESSYQLRYVTVEGRLVESWWGESALAA